MLDNTHQNQILEQTDEIIATFLGLLKHSNARTGHLEQNEG